jgi:hypothetical protein
MNNNDMMTEYNEALQRNSNDVEARINRGFAYFQQGKWDLAVQDYQRAVNIQRDERSCMLLAGAQFIAEDVKAERAAAEAKRAKEEAERKRQAWLASDEGKEWQAEEKRKKEAEAVEKAERDRIAAAEKAEADRIAAAKAAAGAKRKKIIGCIICGIIGGATSGIILGIVGLTFTIVIGDRLKTILNIGTPIIGVVLGVIIYLIKRGAFLGAIIFAVIFAIFFSHLSSLSNVMVSNGVTSGIIIGGIAGAITGGIAKKRTERE